MLKTVKNGCGIRVDPPPPVFFKIPTFSRFFLETSLTSKIISSHLNNSNFMSCYCKECAMIFRWDTWTRGEASQMWGTLVTWESEHFICSDIMERSFYRLNNSIFWVDLKNLWIKPIQRFSSFLLILGGVWASTEVHGAATTQHWVGGSVFGWGSSPVWSSNLLR